MAIWTRWISPFRPITSCWHCTFLQSMEKSNVKPLDFFWGVMETVRVGNTHYEISLLVLTLQNVPNTKMISTFQV